MKIRKVNTMGHHNIDTWPIPEDNKPCYINEPWLVDDYQEGLRIKYVY